MNGGTLATLEMGRTTPVTLSVLVADKECKQLAAAIAAGPDAKLHTPKSGFGLPLAISEIVRQEILNTAFRGEVPTLVIGEGGICTMPQKLPYYSKTKDGIELKIWSGPIMLRGKLRVRYRFRPPGGKEECFLNPQKAKTRLDEELEDLLKRKKMEDQPEGRAFLDKAQRMFAYFADLGEDPDILLPALCKAKKSLDAACGLGFLPGRPNQILTIPGIIEMQAERERLARTLTPMLVKDAVVEYVAAFDALRKAKSIEESTRKRHRSIVRQFNKTFGKLFMHEVEAPAIEKWLGGVGKTRSGRRSVINAFYERARDILRSVPTGKTVMTDISAGGYKPTKGRNKGGAKIEFFRAADVRKIMAGALAHPDGHKWIPTMVLWFFGGIHMAEIVKLAWRDIYPMGDGGKVVIGEFVAGKNHSERTPILSPANYTFIKKFLPDEITEQWLDSPIIPAEITLGNPATIEGRAHDAWRAFFIDLLGGLGIEDVENGLRHAFCTHLYHLTHNLGYTQRQAGSHTINMFKHYIGAKCPLAEAQAYFCIAHPDAGFFDPTVRWLKDEKFFTEERAADDWDRFRAMSSLAQAEFSRAA